MAIKPTYYIVLALGGIINCFSFGLNDLNGYKKKKSQTCWRKEFQEIKRQFNDIKDESVDHQEDNWLKMRLKENSDD